MGLDYDATMLCKNCRWSRPDKAYLGLAIMAAITLLGLVLVVPILRDRRRFARCANPASPLIFGELPYCAAARRFECRDGALFQSKPLRVSGCRRDGTT